MRGGAGRSSSLLLRSEPPPLCAAFVLCVQSALALSVQGSFAGLPRLLTLPGGPPWKREWPGRVGQLRAGEILCEGGEGDVQCGSVSERPELTLLLVLGPRASQQEVWGLPGAGVSVALAFPAFAPLCLLWT